MLLFFVVVVFFCFFVVVVVVFSSSFSILSAPDYIRHQKYYNTNDNDNRLVQCMYGEHKVRGHGPCSGSELMGDGHTIIFFSFILFSTYLYVFALCRV